MNSTQNEIKYIHKNLQRYGKEKAGLKIEEIFKTKVKHLKSSYNRKEQTNPTVKVLQGGKLEFPDYTFSHAI